MAGGTVFCWLVSGRRKRFERGDIERSLFQFRFRFVHEGFKPEFI